MKPSDFYFTANDDDGICFAFSSISFYNQNHCIQDGTEDKILESILPEGFCNLTDATFELELSDYIEVGKKILIDAGFVFKEDLLEDNTSS